MAEVEVRTRAQIVDPPDGPVEVALRYHVADPYAVTAVFGPGHRDEWTWVFARDLLADGLRGIAGDSDVRIWPAWWRRVVTVELRSDTGRAVLEFPPADLRRFLALTFGWVPAGEESGFLDWDATVARLLEPRRPRPC